MGWPRTVLGPALAMDSRNGSSCVSSKVCKSGRIERCGSVAFYWATAADFSLH